MHSLTWLEHNLLLRVLQQIEEIKPIAYYKSSNDCRALLQCRTEKEVACLYASSRFFKALIQGLVSTAAGKVHEELDRVDGIIICRLGGQCMAHNNLTAPS